MDKRIILAVAGSGKTTHIVNTLSSQSSNQRSLIITYTRNNLSNLKTKIIRKFGYFPENISLYEYFTFLYAFCFRPFLLRNTRAKGINWEMPPLWTLHKKRTNKEYYFDNCNRLYHNRIAKFLEVEDVLDLVKQRIEKYYDNILIDEVQDFGGHDFNLLRSLVQSNVTILLVGDFYQHTFDTSRDGNVNKSLYNDLDVYKINLKKMGLVVDSDTLKNSYRCSSTICRFISKNLGINMESNRDDDTEMHFLKTKEEADPILKCNDTIKLFYKEHYNYNCYSKNWGDSKGADHYSDVCVVLNKETFQKFQKRQLGDLKPQTRNKLYVACTRARNNLYLIPEIFFNHK
jgi:DNA helicase II / ATP-dependent DNA helicase PcrA